MLINAMELTQNSKLHGLVNLQNDAYALTWPAIRELYDFLPWGDPVRVMARVAQQTGCHKIELNMMKKSFLHEDGTFYFETAKKRAKQLRKVQLSMDLVKELNHYWNHHMTFKDMMFGISSDTWTRYFNRDVRPKLSHVWNEKRPTAEKGKLYLEYVCQLKGFRHTYATMKFAKAYDRYKDAYVAAEMVAKDLKHSVKAITVRHYIFNLDLLGLETCLKYEPHNVMENVSQARVLDYIN